jgi:hypothetical protein
MKRLWLVAVVFVFTGLLAGCSGDKAEEPKNPVPPPKTGPTAAPGGGKDKGASQPAPPPPPPPRR